jgi:hypothetical protein
MSFMAFTRDSNLRMGDRSEYLAQYFLSALGVSVLVPRQEDIGIDFFCWMAAEKNGRRLTYSWPFWVQIGSEGSKKFEYGGVNNATGEWKHWEIEGLRDLPVPFFVGLVDKEKHRLRLFSSSAKWYLLHSTWPIGQLELCPYDSRHPLKYYQIGEIDTKCGSLPCFQVPLGAPIFEVSVEDIGTEQFAAASKTLVSAIDVEYKNLAYSKIGTPYACCPKEGRCPNEPLNGFYYSFASRPDKLDEQLDRMRPVFISIAVNLKNHNRRADLEKLRPSFDLLPLSDEDRKILDGIYGGPS